MYYVGENCKSVKNLPRDWYKFIKRFKTDGIMIYVTRWFRESVNFQCFTENEFKEGLKPMPESLIELAQQHEKNLKVRKILYVS